MRSRKAVRVLGVDALVIAAVAPALMPVPHADADRFALFAPGTVFPVHQCVIRDFGIPLLEGLQLEPLVATGRREFLFVASALPIVGATGSPLAPLAVL